MKKIKKYIFPILIITILIVMVFRQLGKNKSEMESNTEIANKKMTVFPVTVVSIKEENISQNFKVTGDFEPLHQLNFLSETSGRVVRVKVKNGDYVKRGQEIASVDNEQINIDLKLAEANLEKTKSDLEKYNTMLENNAVNKQQVEEVKLSVINAETKVLTLKRQLRVSAILSPLSGTVNNLSLEIGSYLTPGSVIAEIIDVSRLKMNVSVLDNEIVKVSNGQNINIIADIYPNDKIVGKVIFVSPKADASGRYTVEIEFANNTKQPLKAGMTGIADFELGGEKIATLLPLKCLVGSMKLPQVFVVEGDVVRLRKISIGSIHQDKIEIVSGLTISDKVVETGQSNLSKGSKIKIIK